MKDDYRSPPTTIYTFTSQIDMFALLNLSHSLMKMVTQDETSLMGDFPQSVAGCAPPLQPVCP